MKKSPISLLPHQEKHVESIWNLLVKDRVFSYIDTSKTGAGKTIASLEIAWRLQKNYGTQIAIIAPSDTSLNNDDGWLAHAKENGIDISLSSTYPSIRSMSDKNPWLLPNPENKKKWEASPEFIRLCQQGLFLIFDEFHNCKNPSITHFACAALVKVAKEHRATCRVALISHTPGDKTAHLPQLLRMTGLITSTKLFRHIPFTRDYEWEEYGLGELATVCKKIDRAPEARQRIHDMMFRISASRSHGICKELYDKYIRSNITFAMPEPKNSFSTEMYNIFLENDGEGLKMVQDGIALLRGAVGWDPVTEQVAPQAQWQLGNISVGLKLLEKGKLQSIANYVIRESKKNPSKKFVVSCGARSTKTIHTLAKIISENYVHPSYTDLLFDLKKGNSDWAKLPKDMIHYISSFLEIDPPILNGETSKADRVSILRDFQKNSIDSWCLLMSPAVGSESISLHDRFGKHPRELLIVPDFYFSRTTQCVGRVVRVGMQSDTKVLIVYSKGAGLETSILQSMLRKSKNARDLLAEGQKVVLPGEFPFRIEGEPDPVLLQQLNNLYNR